jgi:hypothetical protein
MLVCVCINFLFSHSILFYVRMRIKLSSTANRKHKLFKFSFLYVKFSFFSVRFMFVVSDWKDRKWIFIIALWTNDNNIYLEHYLLVLFCLGFFFASLFSPFLLLLLLLFLLSGKKRTQLWIYMIVRHLQSKNKKKLSPIDNHPR